MFNFWNKQRSVADRPRRPVTIGFEQLEVREFCSVGLALTIIPTETRPLLSMPRPYVASFDPQAERPVTVSWKPKPEAKDGMSPLGLWRLGGRFRFRID